MGFSVIFSMMDMLQLSENTFSFSCYFEKLECLNKYKIEFINLFLYVYCMCMQNPKYLNITKVFYPILKILPWVLHFSFSAYEHFRLIHV